MCEEGLYDKYKVIKNSTKEEVAGAFVLLPESDPIAIAALKTYAELTDNVELANNIECWLETLEMIGKEMPPVCDYCEDIAKVKSTPFMADVGARMCKKCWDSTRREYRLSNGEEIGEF